MNFETYHTPVLIIGSGIAGLTSAITLAEAGIEVLVVTKSHINECNSAQAQGGIACAWDEHDSPADHARDTITAGAGLCNPVAVEVLVREGPDAIRTLIEWGARFDSEGERLLLTQEGGHNRRRILHANGDATGLELERALYAKAALYTNIKFIEDVTIVDLLTTPKGVTGAWGLYNSSGKPLLIEAAITLLASGGLCAIYRDTTNPKVTTGDGIVMAWAAGATVADLEFIQFHPTALALPGIPRYLLTEALRGEGAHLLTKNGDRFMPRHHQLAELAPRDIVARAEMLEMQQHGDSFVLLDARHLGADFLSRRFPGLVSLLEKFSLSLAKDLIPVAPAAHYTIGGILTDLYGRTTLPCLYAAGEVACTGVHGANRLASNSLLECVVFGRRAARAIVNDLDSNPKASLEKNSKTNPVFWEIEKIDSNLDLENLLNQQLGVFRTGHGLDRAATQLAPALRLVPRKISDDITLASVKSRNRYVAAALVARFAQARRESRGAHYRADFPTSDPRWRFRHALIGEKFEQIACSVA